MRVASNEELHPLEEGTIIYLRTGKGRVSPVRYIGKGKGLGYRYIVETSTGRRVEAQPGQLYLSPTVEEQRQAVEEALGRREAVTGTYEWRDNGPLFRACHRTDE